MSRILDALRKQDAQGSGPRSGPRRERSNEPTLPPLPPEAPRPLAAAQAAGPAVVPGADPMVEPERPAPMLPHAVEVAPTWPGAVLPELSPEFHRELSGLRLQVDGALIGRRPRVVLLTSSVEGEGATTVAASFARVLAEDGASRVLLVDANRRRPGLAEYFRIVSGPGLSEVLHAGQSFDSAVQAVERQNLHVLGSMAGGITANLYAQQLVRAFLGQYGSRYDYVLFDAPPLLDSPETAILGSAVDTTLLVIRASSTKGGVVSRSLDALAKAGVPVLGLVLNRRRLDIPEFLYKRL